MTALDTTTLGALPARDSRRAIALWLLACCALIFAMVVLGGVTRLTRSGLSIVEWDPVMGAIPPLTEVQWHEAFDKYKQTPEYQKVNFGMSLDEFKSIFYVEWAHRLLGRAIGLVFIVPLLYFALKRRIPPGLTPKLLGIFILGGLQGALGWYMVKSGLVSDPHVSPYRLTAHLGLAFVIYGYILWIALGLLFPEPGHRQDVRALRRFGIVVTVLIFIMVLSGGFVAGLKAGFLFNTFPTMNGAWIPPGVLALEPVWRNFFENHATVQLDHRLIAYLLAVVVPLFWWAARQKDLSERARLGVNLLLAVLAVQITLGITTLLFVVPVPLAAAHQGGALALFTVALFVVHELRPGRR